MKGRSTGFILTACGVVCCVALGCGPPRGPRYVTDPDPSVKIPAIKAAVSDRDRAAIPQLVGDLASDDPAVRFYAIGALQRMTGETMGYHYYASDAEREVAVNRWKAWLAQQPQVSPSKN